MKAGSATRLGLLAMLWGSSFLWISLALEGLAPVQIALVRVAIGAVVLAATVRLRGLRLPRDVATWRALTVAALLACAVPYTLFGIAEQTVDSAVAGAINATTPLWTFAIALAAGTESRPDPRRAVGLALGLTGAVLLLAPWHTAGTGALGGSLACVGAAASYGLGYVYMGRRLVGVGIPPLVLAAAQLVAATGLMALTIPLAGRHAVHLDGSVVGAMAVLGLGGTGLAYVLSYRLIVDEGPTAASTVTYLMPAIAITLGVGTRGDALTWRLAAGTAVVLIGVALAQRRPTQAETPTGRP